MSVRISGRVPPLPECDPGHCRDALGDGLRRMFASYAEAPLPAELTRLVESLDRKAAARRPD